MNPVQKGILHWDNKEFFEAHVVWEEYWHTIRKDPSKEQEKRFVQGLIQLACALVHYERGNMEWYDRLLASGSELLRNHEHQLDPERFITLAQMFPSSK